MIRSPDDPIAALATPLASSALAVIRVSGTGSLDLLARLVKGGGTAASWRGNSIRRRVMRDGEEDVDEVMLAVYRAPRSYTGEDSAEIISHGSIPVIQRLLSLLTRSGFRPAGPGEFTQRAFLNGRMDLTRAEAVNEIVRARTDRARALALQRLSGAIESRVRAAREGLVDLRAGLEVAIDYPEDQHEGGLDHQGALDRTISLLEGLTRTYRQGRIYQEGASVAIAGATNSGKSSLFNAILRQERAIVSDVHGTTRDWLEGTVSLEGIPVRLFDTAGLRRTSDPLEVEGMRRTGQVLESADCVIYIVDSTRGLDDEDRAFLSRRSGVPLVRAWNKVDLPESRSAPEGFMPLSATTGHGLEKLETEVAATLGSPAESGEPLIDSVRQRDLIGRALAALGRLREARARGVSADLLAVDLADAMDALGEITGEITTAEVLERMFAAFCVGK
ncbi:MAG: tRNA uridine-5-carboxymethylaminomethyl(34) synthesis GTPase MnmE [Spirochaetia bacterium]